MTWRGSSQKIKIFTPTPNDYCRHKLIAMMLGSMHLQKESSCLEVGCGNGEFISYASTRGLNVMGIDTSEKSVSCARQKNPSAVIMNKDLFDMEGAFDAIFSFEVLEHVENDEAAINKISQLLKKGGYFLFSVPAHPALYYEAVDKYYGHYRRYERNALINLLEANNMKVVYFWSYGLKLASVLANIVFSYRRKEHVKFGAIGDTLYEVKYPFYWEKIVNPLLSLIYPLFHLYDRLFLNHDIGHSYVVLCQRK